MTRPMKIRNTSVVLFHARNAIAKYFISVFFFLTKSKDTKIILKSAMLHSFLINNLYICHENRKNRLYDEPF